MPFLTYQVSAEQAMQNAARLFQEGAVAAVKLEGGRPIADTICKLTEAGLPVMGHLGLIPQHVHRLGGMKQQARDDEAAQELRQADFFAHPVQKKTTHILFQCADGMADCRLREVKFPCGDGETAHARKRRKGPQLFAVYRQAHT